MYLEQTTNQRGEPTGFYVKSRRLGLAIGRGEPVAIAWGRNEAEAKKRAEWALEHIAEVAREALQVSQLALDDSLT